MKNLTILKYIRQLLALLVLLPFTFLFIDFRGFDTKAIEWLPKIQFIPSIMSLLSGVVIGILPLLIILLTALFGRVYCSVICPLGILQDVFSRISNLFTKKKRYKYAKPLNVLRYVILAVCVITFAFGSMSLISYLDPYSNFGRIAHNVFQPVYLAANNVAVNVVDWFGGSALYFVSISLNGFTFWFSLGILIAVGATAYLRGRLVCNSVCPVGATLSLLSRYSAFKLSFDKSTCNKCGKCATKCKSQCIDVKNQTVDFSRCVTCYNCINVCDKNAMSYSFAWGGKSKKAESPNTVVVDDIVNANNQLEDNSRRRFLGTAVASVAAVTVAYAQSKDLEKKTYVKESAIAPPGAISIAHLKSRCTACHLCVAKCPTQVIKPATLEYGFSGLMMPRMDYVQSFCNFECTVCSDVCPNGALQPLTIEEKKTSQIGKVIFVKELCVVFTDGTDCGACSEHCPTKAVDMLPYKDGLRLPHTNQSICIGCGGCEFICPVRPFRAIYVEGNPIHLLADKPKEEKQEDIQLDGFGF